jgi:hypothetical protein
MHTETNTNNPQHLELKLSQDKLAILVEDNYFYNFKHQIQIDNLESIGIKIYYQNLDELKNIINFLVSLDLLKK